MYDNIGGKIKVLSIVIFIFESLVAVAAGCSILAESFANEYISHISGLFILILGPIVAWISSWLLYGFGQLIENSDKMVVLSKQNLYLKREHVLGSTEKHSDEKWKCEKCGSIVTASLDHCPFCELFNTEPSPNINNTKTQ